MEIVIYDSNLEKKDVKNNKISIACRGLIINNNKVLTVVETKWNLVTLPGGRLEEGESLTDCVIREVKEETGVIVTNPVETVRVIEHFENVSFMSIYFRCDFVEETNQTNFTELEKEIVLTKKWFEVTELLEELNNEVCLHPYAQNIQNREFIGVMNSL